MKKYLLRKNLIAAVLLSLALMLASCETMGLDSDRLLTPPQMNAADREILRAIDSVSSSYKLIYPKSGTYQTAVTSADMTGDGLNEAICFYLDGNNKTVSVIVLESIDGSWTVKGKSDSRANAVVRVNFCDLNGDGIKEIVIGWQFQSGEEKAIEVFGFGTDTALKSLYTGMYNNFIAFDDSVVVISRNTSGTTASASLIGRSGNTVSILNTVALNNSIVSFVSVQSGRLSDSRRIVYIDEQLENLMYTTEVLTIEKTGELSRSPDDISTKTMRTRAYRCLDINDDKLPDIPVEKSFPAYERNKQQENLTYVEWYDYDGTSLSFLKTAYTSLNEQFMIELPRDWIGSITIQRDSDTERAVHFYYIDKDDKSDTAEPIPMFSVRVFSQQEYSDTVQSLGWQTISTSSENVYTFRSDNSELPPQFDADKDTVSALFKLLS